MFVFSEHEHFTESLIQTAKCSIMNNEPSTSSWFHFILPLAVRFHFNWPIDDWRTSLKWYAIQPASTHKPEIQSFQILHPDPDRTAIEFLTNAFGNLVFFTLLINLLVVTQANGIKMFGINHKNNKLLWFLLVLIFLYRLANSAMVKKKFKDAPHSLSFILCCVLHYVIT